MHTLNASSLKRSSLYIYIGGAPASSEELEEFGFLKDVPDWSSNLTCHPSYATIYLLSRYCSMPIYPTIHLSIHQWLYIPMSQHNRCLKLSWKIDTEINFWQFLSGCCTSRLPSREGFYFIFLFFLGGRGVLTVSLSLCLSVAKPPHAKWKEKWGNWGCMRVQRACWA